MEEALQNRPRGRKDHYSPRGYLRGFIDPARADRHRPLWHYDLESRQWSEKSPAEVGFDYGFYDYANGTGPDLEHPDVTFERFEREFPLVREQMLERSFRGWKNRHKTFLLEYMQMMRARSPMFIEQGTKQNENSQVRRVTAVLPNNQVQVTEPFAPPPEFVRNRTINMMREEIQKGADWMANFRWCLRYTKDVTDPFVTSDQALVLDGQAPNLVEAMTHPETLIWFPLCWQACLIGSLRRFDDGTDEADPSLLRRQRDLFRRPSAGYVISPSKIEWLA